MKLSTEDFLMKFGTVLSDMVPGSLFAPRDTDNILLYFEIV
jgi:hypothetical protein